MKIREVYEKFGTPDNLRTHMLRVAALSKILTDVWQGPRLTSQAVVAACALHDIAKPLNFDLSKFRDYGQSETEAKKVKKLQKFLKEIYGEDEHRVSVEICKTSAEDPEISRIVDNIEWKYVERLMKVKDYPSLVSIYCDMRIGPNGILTVEERMNDLEKRRNPEDIEKRKLDGRVLESEIIKNVSLDLNSITDETLNSQLEKILEIKI